MRKYLIAAAALALGAMAVNVPSQAQPYGPGMMGGGYGGGYGPGYGGMMGPGYGGGNGYGPGMMYGYGPDGRAYGRGSDNSNGQSYRGKRLCWHQTDAQSNQGYYEPCQN